MLEKRGFKGCLAALASACLLAATSFAQQERKPPDETEIRVEVDAVNLLVSVTNKRGRSVTHLTQENFSCPGGWTGSDDNQLRDRVRTAPEHRPAD